MTTPREIPAADVVRGMRVRVEQRHSGPDGETVETIEGRVYGTANANIQFGNGVTKYLSYDHPVTVLAEPEPEWVEGAWYWVELQEKRTLMRRVGRGWSALADTEYAFHSDNNVTVLGRALIVDWPGDDMAQVLVEAFSGNRDDFAFPANRMAVKVADAIRTQGGVR